jgi:hypothetical protein
MQMLTMIRRIGGFLLVCAVLAFLVSTIVCAWFPESTFELDRESRLPKWITLPPGLTRADVSLSMSYCVWPWGSSATFALRDSKGKILTKVSGKVRGLGPNQLKESSPGSPPGYPSYEVITVNGMTEIIEHRRMEPIFYLSDDPAVRKELGVWQN